MLGRYKSSRSALLAKNIKEDSRFSAAEDRGQYSVSGHFGEAKLMSSISF